VLLVGDRADLDDEGQTREDGVDTAAWAQPRHPGIDPDTALRAILIWSCLHGAVSLEIAGNFASMSLDPSQLFETQLTTLTT
jgi:hypothetical protein